MKQRVFALVDCNNFFASCERVFQPKLNNVPVVVLSNNDGCIIARSSEAKELGIPMGAPLFKWQKFLEAHKVQVLSSNYKLYGEMSGRVMEILQQFSPRMEIYSIDEAFLSLDHIPESEVEDYARKIRAAVLQWIGMPVSIGLGPTKTLAKLANYRAKKTPESGGVVSFMKADQEILKTIPVEEIWGVGRALAPKLQRMGIHTAAQMASADPEMIHSRLGISSLSTLHELRGESCYEGGDEPSDPKSIICTRSFRTPRTTLVELSQAVSSFIERATEQLRGDNMAVKHMTVHLSTSRYNQENYYSNSKTVILPIETSDTLKLINLGLMALESIFEENRQYKRAGVSFSGLIPAEEAKKTLFSDEDSATVKKLMETLDQINSQRHQIFVGSSGRSNMAGSDRQHVSPNYLTEWGDILTVKAK